MNPQALFKCLADDTRLKTVLLIAVIGFLTGRPDFLDLGIAYALINFISVIGVLRFSDSIEFKHPLQQQASPKEDKQ